MFYGIRIFKKAPIIPLSHSKNSKIQNYKQRKFGDLDMKWVKHD